MSSADESFMTTNDGVRIFYETRSPASAPAPSVPTLVLIHGWSGSSEVFIRNFEALSRTFPVVRYDLRAHGESGTSTHGLRVSRLSKDLQELISELRLSNVILIGCSLGSAVIWNYVELFGLNGISGCIFVDQSPYQEYASDGSWRLGSNGMFSDAALATFCTKLVDFPLEAHQGTVHACLTRMPTKEEIEFFANEGMKADAQALAAIMKDHNKNDWRETTRLVTCPVLVVVGGSSKIFPPQGVREVAKHMPKAKIAELETGSHWVYYEEAEWFNGTVTEFALSVQGS